MSLLFEVIKSIGKKIDGMPLLEDAMKQIEAGGKPSSVEGEICSLYLELKRAAIKCE